MHENDNSSNMNKKRSVRKTEDETNRLTHNSNGEKKALQYLDTIKSHDPDFDCDIDGGSDNPATTDKEIPTGPATSLSPDVLPPLLYDTSAIMHILPILYWHSATQSHTETKMPSKVNDTTEYTGMDWQKKEDQRKNCQIEKQQTHEKFGKYSTEILMHNLEDYMHRGFNNFLDHFYTRAGTTFE